MRCMKTHDLPSLSRKDYNIVDLGNDTFLIENSTTDELRICVVSHEVNWEYLTEEDICKYFDDSFTFVPFYASLSTIHQAKFLKSFFVCVSRGFNSIKFFRAPFWSNLDYDMEIVEYTLDKDTVHEETPFLVLLSYCSYNVMLQKNHIDELILGESWRLQEMNDYEKENNSFSSKNLYNADYILPFSTILYLSFTPGHSVEQYEFFIKAYWLLKNSDSTLTFADYYKDSFVFWDERDIPENDLPLSLINSDLKEILVSSVMKIYENGMMNDSQNIYTLNKIDFAMYLMADKKSMKNGYLTVSDFLKCRDEKGKIVYDMNIYTIYSECLPVQEFENQYIIDKISSDSNYSDLLIEKIYEFFTLINDWVRKYSADMPLILFLNVYWENPEKLFEQLR